MIHYRKSAKHDVRFVSRIFRIFAGTKTNYTIYVDETNSNTFRCFGNDAGQHGTKSVCADVVYQ